jgi:hypothetical protein
MPYFGIPIRNGLPIGLGSVAGFGVQQFSPADLFSAGEQGAWYDPSDLSTLFTDSAGTTPVTAVEQFVGLMLDKSKGLVLGSEIAPSTNYSSGWTTQPGVTLPGTTAVYTSVANNNGAYFGGGANIVAGRFYEVTYTISSLTAGGLAIYIGGTPSTVTRTVAGTYTERLGTVATDGFVTLRAVGTTTAVILSFSIKQVTGNHATQTTSAKRPKLAARYNLLTYTEQFDNGAWTKSGLNAFGSGSVANTTATTDPLGGNTADYIQENTATSAHLVIQTATVGANVSAVFSIYAKAAERTFLLIYPESSAGAGAGVWFNLSTGAVGTQGSGRTGSITSVGNGWYRCTVTCSIATADYRFYAGPASADNVVSYAGTGTSGIYIWGADLRPASQATGLIGPTYQRVVDAATYDAVGFLPYLEFDGLDDSMSTNSIDFSATDKMTVWAGVRKLSDATLGMLAETSAVANSNNGAIAIGAPGWSPVAARYGSLIKGTSAIALFANSPNSFAAQITNVLAMQYDLAGASNSDVMKMRLNAASQSLTFFDGPASGGNFGNYPLYIGQRNNASFPFNGWLTSLIVRGAQSTQGQIEATESWVAGKTGVSL